MRLHRHIAAVFLFVVATVLATGAAAADKRIALVIGNGKYEHAGPLPNPPHDAAAISEKLRGLGFEVIEGVDLDYGRMRRTVRQFAERLSGADVAVLFYAGHGLQVGGRNFLVPVDAELSSETALSFEAFDAETDLLQHMEREAKVNLVFLDACRDNPLARTLARGMKTRSTSVGRGLAQMQVGVGSLITYATQPGNTAADGAGRNSPFTTAVLQFIDSPGMEVRQMLTRVRQSVIEQTDGKQVPWDHSSLTGDFYFVAPAPVAAAPPAAPPPVPAASAGDTGQDRSIELAYWQSAEREDNAQAYKIYLDRYPKGAFADLARLKMAARQETPATSQARSEASKAIEPKVALAPTPAPPPAPPSVDPIEERYVATARANLRERPDAEAPRVTTLDAGAELNVTGKVRGIDWYRVRLGDGRTAFVYGRLIVPAGQAAAAAAPPPSAAAAGPGRTIYVEAIRQGRNEFPFLVDVVGNRLASLPETTVTQDAAAGRRAETVVSGSVVRIDKNVRANPEHQGAMLARQFLGGLVPTQNIPASFNDYEVEVALTAQDRRGGRAIAESAIFRRTLTPDEERRGGVMMLLQAATAEAARRLVSRMTGNDPGPPVPVDERTQARPAGR